MTRSREVAVEVDGKPFAATLSPSGFLRIEADVPRQTGQSLVVDGRAGIPHLPGANSPASWTGYDCTAGAHVNVLPPKLRPGERARGVRDGVVETSALASTPWPMSGREPARLTPEEA